MRVKIIKLVLALLFVTVFSHAQTDQLRKAGGSKTKIIFFDDFSGPSLDRTKWNVIITGFTVNDEQQAYVDSSATLYIIEGEKAEGANNGALVIEPVYDPGFVTKDGKKFDFLSGRIDTKNK